MKNFVDLKCDYNLYKSFYAVIKLGSFSSAAKSLYVSQPTISYNIKKLENILGTKLIYRNSKTVYPTLEGKKFYNYIDKAHSLLVCGEKAMADSLALIDGDLSIGAPTHIANFLLVKVIRKFNEKYPNIKLNIFSRSTKEMVQMLNDNIIDLVIDSYPIDNVKDEIIVRHLTSAKTCLAFSPEYYDGKMSIDNKTFILPNKYTETRRIIDNYLAVNNITINKVLEVSTTELTMSMTLQNMGIGYFFEASIEKEIECNKLKKLDLIGELPEVKIGYAHSRYYVTNATQTFIKILEEYCAKT